MDFLQIIIAIIGAIGGWEAIRYLINLRTNKRKAEAEADTVEFHILRETIEFLQLQLKLKEERFAEQTQIVRQQNVEILEQAKRISTLEAERSLKLCERRACADRQPQSGY